MNHETKLNYKTDGTHNGTAFAIAGVVEQLAKISERCAIIDSIEMKITWHEGSTYQIPLKTVSISTTDHDPEYDEKIKKMHDYITEEVRRCQEYYGIKHLIGDKILEDFATSVISEDFIIFDNDNLVTICSSIDVIVDEFNKIAERVKSQYRIVPNTAEGLDSKYILEDTTREE